MAGHSKWHNIQHRKGRQDAARGKAFTKVAKEIILAAKSGGGDIQNNARLRNAVASARAVNLPKDKIEAAIKKGTGELAGGDLMEIIYEGYAPGGVALLIEVATDNKNRSISDVRHIITKHGGSMGEAGCVAWMFNRIGCIEVEKSSATEEQLMELTLAFTVEDIEESDGVWEVYVSVDDFVAVKDALESANCVITKAEITRKAQNTIDIDTLEVAQKVIKIVESLEEHDDVQAVHANFTIDDALVEDLE